MGSGCSWRRAGCPRSTAPPSTSLSRRWIPPPRPSAPSFTHEFKGAPSRVPAEATACGYRREHVLVEILATLVDRSDKEEEQRHRQWARATRQAFSPITLPGGYPNFLVADDAERVAQSYGPNAGRLIAAERHYDPDNIFNSAIPLPGSAAQL